MAHHEEDATFSSNQPTAVSDIAKTAGISAAPVSQESKAQPTYKEMNFFMPNFEYENFSNYPQEGYACLDDEFADSKKNIQLLSMAFGKDYNKMAAQEQLNWAFIGRVLFSSYLPIENRQPIMAMLAQVTPPPPPRQAPPRQARAYDTFDFTPGHHGPCCSCMDASRTYHSPEAPCCRCMKNYDTDSNSSNTHNPATQGVRDVLVNGDNARPTVNSWATGASRNNANFAASTVTTATPSQDTTIEAAMPEDSSVPATISIQQGAVESSTASAPATISVQQGTIENSAASVLASTSVQQAAIENSTSKATEREVIDVEDDSDDDSDDDRPLKDIRQEQLALASEAVKKATQVPAGSSKKEAAVSSSDHQNTSADPAKKTKAMAKAKKASKVSEATSERGSAGMGGKYPAYMVGQHPIAPDAPRRQATTGMCDCSRDRVIAGCRHHDPRNSQSGAGQSSGPPRRPSQQPQSAFTRSFFGDAPRSNNQSASKPSTSGAPRPVNHQPGSQPSSYAAAVAAPRPANHQPGSQPSSYAASAAAATAAAPHRANYQPRSQPPSATTPGPSNGQAQETPQKSSSASGAPKFSTFPGNKYQNLNFKKYSEGSTKAECKQLQQKRRHDENDSDEDYQNQPTQKYRKTLMGMSSVQSCRQPGSKAPLGPSSGQQRSTVGGKTLPQSSRELMDSSGLRRSIGGKTLPESSRQLLNLSSSQQLVNPQPFYTQMLGQISHPQQQQLLLLQAQAQVQQLQEPARQSESSEKKQKAKASGGSEENRPSSWNDHEFQAILYELRTLRDDEARRGIPRNRGLRDVRLWTAISDALVKYGVLRTASACKNFWSREGRAKSYFDERANPDPNNMATSVQHPRHNNGGSRP